MQFYDTLKLDSSVGIAPYIAATQHRGKEMNLLYLFLIGYASVSVVAALVIYAACVASSRMRRMEEGEALDVDQADEEEVNLPHPMKPVL